MLLFYFKPQNQCWAQKNCKCTYNAFALNVEVMLIHIFTKYWNNSRFKQNLAVILTEAMYLDRRHPFMQKSYFGQNVTYTVFALRGRYTHFHMFFFPHGENISSKPGLRELSLNHSVISPLWVGTLLGSNVRQNYLFFFFFFFLCEAEWFLYPQWHWPAGATERSGYAYICP